jgi:hypothetical protein
MGSTKLQRSELLRWLADRGCPVDILEVESSITIEQQIDDVTHLFELPDGRTGCILDLRVINEGPGHRSIRDLEFTMPWSDFGFQLLDDPKEMGEDSYWFPSTQIDYRRHMVLNHALLPDGILQPNCPKSGLLLGIGNPIPPDFFCRAPFTGVLRLIPDSGTPGTCEIRLWVDRSMRRAKSNKQPKYDGLYGTNLRSERPSLRSAERNRDDDVSRPAHRSAHQQGDGYIRPDNGKRHTAEKEQ